MSCQGWQGQALLLLWVLLVQLLLVLLPDGV
jgi:hypothetical protein